MDTTLGFDPSGVLGNTPFPTDSMRTQTSGDWLIDGFSEGQLTSMAFLDQLRLGGVEGFSATSRIRIPFSSEIGNLDIKLDQTTLADGVRLYDVSGDAAERRDLTEFRVRPKTYAVTCRPATPLEPGNTYAVAVVGAKLKTRAGGAVRPSEVYRGIQSAGDPATDASFAKVQAADADISGRGDTVAFFQFTVADYAGPILMLRDIIAGQAEVSVDGARETMGITRFFDENRQLAISASPLAKDSSAVADLFGPLPSETVGTVVKGYFCGPNFMSDLDVTEPQSYFKMGTFRGENRDIPISADNPVALSQKAPYRTLPYLAFLPSEWPEDADGNLEPLDVVVALHGFNGAKEDWYAIANTITSTGKALVAIDAYQHGERQNAVAYPEGRSDKKIDEAIEVIAPGSNFPDPFLNPTFLDRTRAKFGQSIADVLTMIQLLSAGDGTNGLIDFNGDGRADRIGSIHLLGMSLGGIIGSAVAAVSPQVKRVAFYGTGGGLADLARDSEELGLPLSLLIFATSNVEPFGLLAGSGKAMLIDRAEREVYGVVVDAFTASADPANFGRAIISGELRGDEGARVLLQLTDFDLVIPNNASDRLARSLAAGAAEGEVALVPPAGGALFEMGIPTATDGAGLKGMVTQYAGAHGVLLDFADPAATAAAQAEVATFLAAP